MRMHDMMRRAVTVQPKDTVASAARKMRESDASSCLVIDGEVILGIVSERDIVAKIVAAERHPLEVQVADVMTVIPTASNEQARGRITDLLGAPASALEDAEGAYELALTGAPIDLNVLTGVE